MPQRDYLSLSPNGRVILIYNQNDNAFSHLDAYLITELRVDASVSQTMEDSVRQPKAD